MLLYRHNVQCSMCILIYRLLFWFFLQKCILEWNRQFGVLGHRRFIFHSASRYWCYYSCDWSKTRPRRGRSWGRFWCKFTKKLRWSAFRFISYDFLNFVQVLGEVPEQVKTGLWVGDCFIYTNSVNRINYYVGGEIVTVSHLDRTMYLLGYVSKDNR